MTQACHPYARVRARAHTHTSYAHLIRPISPPMFSNQKVLVTGAGGFIGGHLVRYLKNAGAASIRAADCKPLSHWHQVHPEVVNLVVDLREKSACFHACREVDVVFNLAADMGGMGFIENNKAACMLNVLINTHLLQAADFWGASRFFYASSACVYPDYLQKNGDCEGLKEDDAYPAMPEDGYGWEKLFSERMCRHYQEDFGIETRVARYHNVYGPHGAWTGGREKAPAAICRKVAEAKIRGTHAIDIWGDGEQVRSFTYIDDCLKGSVLLTQSEHSAPLNIGSAYRVTINELVDIVEGIAGLKLQRNYQPHAPKGVRSRNSDNTQIKDLFNWEPGTALEDGLAATYAWIYDQVLAEDSGKARVSTVDSVALAG